MLLEERSQKETRKSDFNLDDLIKYFSCFNNMKVRTVVYFLAICPVLVGKERKKNCLPGLV